MNGLGQEQVSKQIILKYNIKSLNPIFTNNYRSKTEAQGDECVPEDFKPKDELQHKLYVLHTENYRRKYAKLRMQKIQDYSRKLELHITETPHTMVSNGLHFPDSSLGGAAVLTNIYLTLSTIQWSLPVLWKPPFKEIPVFHTLRINSIN